MAHDVGIEVTSLVEENRAHSASVERMRRHRDRRRKGLTCVTIPLPQAQINGLIRKGWLPRAERADRTAIGNALLQYLYDNLG
jgi:hypothetical protein